MSKGAKKLAFNTIVIYLQRFSSAALALITTPLILKYLGVVDYGIYNISVGFVGMLGFLNWSLSASTQRFITIAVGNKKENEVGRIFSSAFLLHFIYALVLLVSILLFGEFVAGSVLSVPADRLPVIPILFAQVAFISFCNILSIPFTGLLRANENFTVIAILGVLESSLKMLFAILLAFSWGDKLIFYGTALGLLSFLILVINIIYCYKKYLNNKIRISYCNRKTIIEMLHFLGWSSLGALAVAGRNQGVSVLINVFFGVIMNAAYGIAMQVNSALTILSQGVTGALTPRVMKKISSGKPEESMLLIQTMSKFAFLAISLLAIPLLFDIEWVLGLWLNAVPDGTYIFTRLMLLLILTSILSAGIQTMFEALGKVKSYNMGVSIILLFNLPVSFLLFKLKFPAYSILLVSIVLEWISLYFRIRLLNSYFRFSLFSFIRNIFFGIILPVLITICLVYISRFLIDSTSLNVFISSFLTLAVLPLLYYFLSFNAQEKAALSQVLDGLGKKIKK